MAQIRWYKVISCKGGAPVAVAASNPYEAADIAHQRAGIKNPLMVWSITGSGTLLETWLTRHWANEKE